MDANDVRLDEFPPVCPPLSPAQCTACTAHVKCTQVVFLRARNACDALVLVHMLSIAVINCLPHQCIPHNVPTCPAA